MWQFGVSHLAGPPKFDFVGGPRRDRLSATLYRPWLGLLLALPESCRASWRCL
jgi:hypothetical protein